MLQVSDEEVVARLRLDNPWWATPDEIPFASLPRRDYLAGFLDRLRQHQVNRAVVLMGPRRVGKTVLIHHAIQDLLQRGTSPDAILYLSLDTPIYTGLSLERLFTRFRNLHGHPQPSQLYVFFDEIQYLRDWEVHLKSMVDTYRDCRFAVSGSAAAALRLKSQESGAGRFSDLFLPPLTFAEFLRFTHREAPSKDLEEPSPEAMEALNRAFVDYINFGGYPEAVFIEEVRDHDRQFIRRDIIDKVLLRDLPSLYGISDIQELNRLFTTLVYNSGHEISLEGLAKQSGVVKATIKRYLEYLEAAFLIRRLPRVDQNARRFERATSFKVYLTNPSMRAALFGPITAEDPAMGVLAETALITQYVHGEQFFDLLTYARWKEGRRDREVDLVIIDPVSQKPVMAYEIKWSDRVFDHPDEAESLIRFSRAHPEMMPEGLWITSRSQAGTLNMASARVRVVPIAFMAVNIGRYFTLPGQ